MKSADVVFKLPLTSDRKQCRTFRCTGTLALNRSERGKAFISHHMWLRPHFLETTQIIESGHEATTKVEWRRWRTLPASQMGVIIVRTLTFKSMRILGESKGLIRVENIPLTKVQCPFIGDV